MFPELLNNDQIEKWVKSDFSNPIVMSKKSKFPFQFHHNNISVV